MSMRTIMIFTEFENIDVINDIRRKYDPLADLVLPHITLVFPFDSELTDEELHGHLEKCLNGVAPFWIELEGFSKQQDKYGNFLFLNVVQGMREIKRIHKLLYDNKLKQFDSGCDYIPHMTVGNRSSAGLLDKAFDDVNQCCDKFKTAVKRISVERIGKNGESIIVIEHELNGEIAGLSKRRVLWNYAIDWQKKRMPIY